MIEAELDERLFVDIGIVTHDNKSLDCLGGVRVGYADNSCLIHVRVHCQHSFNLGRVHVEARHSDGILGTIDDVEKAVVISDRHVTGLKPSVRRKNQCTRPFIFVVAGKDAGTTDPDLADLTDEGVMAFGVDQTDLHPIESTTDRTGPNRCAERGRDRRRGFGQAISLRYLDAKVFTHCLEYGNRRPRSTRQSYAR